MPRQPAPPKEIFIVFGDTPIICETLFGAITMAPGKVVHQYTYGATFRKLAVGRKKPEKTEPLDLPEQTP